MAYFANSSEGDVLEEQCADCPLGRLVCPVASIQSMFNYDQCGQPMLEDAMSMLVDNKGICQVKLLIDQQMPKPLTRVAGIDMGANEGSRTVHFVVDGHGNVFEEPDLTDRK